MQRIFNCNKIHDTSFTADTELNNLTYGSLFCIITWTQHY